MNEQTIILTTYPATPNEDGDLLMPLPEIATRTTESALIECQKYAAWARSKDIETYGPEGEWGPWMFTAWDTDLMQILASCDIYENEIPSAHGVAPVTCIAYNPHQPGAYEAARDTIMQQLVKNMGMLTINKTPIQEARRYAAKMQRKLGKEETLAYHFAAFHPVKGILVQVDSEGNEIPCQMNGVHLTEYATDSATPKQKLNWDKTKIQII